jgi:DNA-binding Lrp family transcriptional regulator
MLVYLLRDRSLEFSAEAKFFLLRFIQEEQQDLRNQVSALANLNVREMAKRIGVTPKVAGSALEELVSQGLLMKGAKRRKLGRPSNEYRSEPEKVQPILVRGKGSCEHELRVARLLIGASQQDEKRLLFANRLLLAVLVAHADEFGVVRGLGRRKISKLTGLKSTVIGSRIETLLKQGFIRAYVPGSSSSDLFRPMSSLYYLNLQELTFGHSLPQIALVHQSNFIEIENEALEVQRIFKCFRVVRSEQSFDQVKFPYLRYVENLSGWLTSCWFASSATREFIPNLQARVDDCASLILSRHWAEVQGMQTVVDPVVWLKIFRLCRVKEEFRDREFKSRRKDLMMMLVEAALCRAKHIHRNLVADFSDLLLGSMRFCILPSAMLRSAVVGRKGSKDPSVIALLAYAPGQFLVSGCHVVEKGKDQSVTRLNFPSESDVPIEKRCFYGLMPNVHSNT